MDLAVRPARLAGDAEQARRRLARRRRARRRRIVVALFVVLALLVGFGSFMAGLLSATVDFATPPPPKAALLLDSHGQLIASIRSPEKSEPVAGNQIATVMRQAIVAAEDERFFEHKGVDPLAIVRAAWDDITNSGPQGGGSTITQQYVKKVYTGSERTLLRKVREAALAVRLEQRVPKSEILTRYLNLLPLGNGAYGVQAAAKFYFGVPASALSLPQAAMLAGLAPAPSLYNPLHDMNAAKSRQLYVLNRMVANHLITSQQASAAYATKLDIVGSAGQQTDDDTTLAKIAPEFVDMVTADLKASLKKQYGAEADDVLFRGGLRVTTTLDPLLQQAVVQALGDVLPSPDDPEAAVVAVDPRNGNLLALTTKFKGGYQHAGFNIATQATRSSGSAIKPFTLTAALENGHTLTERRYGPTTKSVPNPGGSPNPYIVHNAGDEERCTCTLRRALALSVNTIYAPLAYDVGMSKVMRVAGDAGLAPRANLKTNLAAALGVEVTPLSMAKAYSTLVDHGVRHDVRTVLGVRAGGDGAEPGKVLSQQPQNPAGAQVVPPAVADQVTEALRDVVDYGTGTAAKQDFPVYGKTGTNGDEDAWFVGCTRALCIATWMGYDDHRPLRHVEGVSQVYGGTLPAKVFAQTMQDYRGLKAQAAAGTEAPGPSPTAERTPTRRRGAQPPPAVSTSPGGAPASAVPSTTASVIPTATPTGAPSGSASGTPSPGSPSPSAEPTESPPPSRSPPILGANRR